MVSVTNLLLIGSLAVLLTLEEIVGAEPIKFTGTTFKNCKPGLAFDGVQTFCCPPQQNLNGPIVDFVPAPNPQKPLRVRKALQCLSGSELRNYTRKLQKGYELMRALPDDDPRSWVQQASIHCAYGTGCFTQDGTNITIDIHFSFFFYPWHRYFVYFHERILQKLLGDPDFTLHFWNCDNSITTSPPPGSHDGCFKAGHFFPPMYNDPTKATYSNRSERPSKPGAIADLGITLEDRLNITTLPANETIARNRRVIHDSMIHLGNTSRAFLGRNYSVGDTQVRTNSELEVAIGTFEKVHTSVHWWVGGIMNPVRTSARDPFFFAYHDNVDRFWSIWPTLGPNRTNPTDNPDFMDAEFLFWDENKVLRRVKVRDSLTTEALGYCYQQVNDASWIHLP